jgi:hypothetical protein
LHNSHDFGRKISVKALTAFRLVPVGRMITMAQGLELLANWAASSVESLEVTFTGYAAVRRNGQLSSHKQQIAVDGPANMSVQALGSGSARRVEMHRVQLN